MFLFILGILILIEKSIEGRIFMMKMKYCESFILGTVVGTMMGFLFAPKSGRECREDLGDWMMNMMNGPELGEDIHLFMEDIKEEIEDFRKSKVLKEAEDKAEVLLQKANQLVEIAVEKKDDAFEEMANELRDKAIRVTKSVLKKLENEK